MLITHAGVGSIIVALANDKRPVAMARRPTSGEHVDDHQVELAARLEAAGLVEVVEDSRRLLECLTGSARPPAFDSREPWLGASLGTYLASRLGEPVAPRYE